MYECPVTQPMSAVHQYTSAPGLWSNTAWWVYAACVRYPPEVCRMPLGFPVVPGGVEDEQRLLRRERPPGCGDRTGRRPVRPTTRPCPVQVTSMPVRRTTRTCSTGESASATASSTAALSGHGGAAPVLPVGGDHHPGLRVADPGPQGLRGEPGEHHRVRQTRGGRRRASSTPPPGSSAGRSPPGHRSSDPSEISAFAVLDTSRCRSA